MICIKCGKNIPDGTKICQYCGNTLEQPMQTTITENTQNVLTNNQQPVNYNSQQQASNQPNNNEMPQGANLNNKKPVFPIIIVASITIIVIILVIVVSKFYGKNKELIIDNKNIINNNYILDNQQKETSQENTTATTNTTIDTNTNTEKSVSQNSLKKEEFFNTYNANTNTAEDDFLMTVDDVFTVTGRGTAIQGHVERGTVIINDEVDIIGFDKNKKTVITGIDYTGFDATRSAKMGDDIILYVRAVERSEVERGQVVAKPNSISSYKKFKAQIYMLSEEVSNNTSVQKDHYSDFYFRNTDVKGNVTSVEGNGTILLDDTSNITIELEKSTAIEVGTKFEIRENRTAKGYGIVSEIVE